MTGNSSFNTRRLSRMELYTASSSSTFFFFQTPTSYRVSVHIFFFLCPCFDAFNPLFVKHILACWEQRHDLAPCMPKKSYQTIGLCVGACAQRPSSSIVHTWSREWHRNKKSQNKNCLVRSLGISVHVTSKLHIKHAGIKKAPCSPGRAATQKASLAVVLMPNNLPCPKKEKN